MTLCFVDLIGTAPSPVANNIAAVDPGAGGGLLVDVFDMPAVPSIGGGGIPSVTPGAEENLKKLVSSVFLMLKKTDNIRAVTNSQSPGISPGYHEHDPRLFS